MGGELLLRGVWVVHERCTGGARLRDDILVGLNESCVPSQPPR